jgi:hypothetical protein
MAEQYRVLGMTEEQIAEVEQAETVREIIEEETQ